MIHKMGYDGQCENCGDPIHWDEVDEQGNCEACQEAEFEARRLYWEPLYHAEKKAGLLPANHYREAQ